MDPISLLRRSSSTCVSFPSLPFAVPPSQSSYTPVLDPALRCSQADHPTQYYAHYKQATEGDCDESKPPGMFDFKGKAKHKAWVGVKGMSKEDAKAQYVALLKGVRMISAYQESSGLSGYTGSPEGERREKQRVLAAA